MLPCGFSLINRKLIAVLLVRQSAPCSYLFENIEGERAFVGTKEITPETAKLRCLRQELEDKEKKRDILKKS